MEYSLLRYVKRYRRPNCGHGDQAGRVERRDDHMLRRMGRGPVAGHQDDEDHRGKKCIGEPETMPYPERRDGASGGNQECHRIRSLRINATVEKAELHSHAKKANRASREGFLNPVAIEPGRETANSAASIGDGGEDQQENAGGFTARPREKNHEEQRDAAPPTMIRVKRNNTSRRKMLVRRRSQTVSCSIRWYCSCGEKTFAGPVLQQIAGAQSFFAGCAVGSHASLPKRRAIVDQQDHHRDASNDEIAQDSGFAAHIADEDRTDAHVAVHGSVGDEGKLPARETPGE